MNLHKLHENQLVKLVEIRVQNKTYENTLKTYTQHRNSSF